MEFTCRAVLWRLPSVLLLSTVLGACATGSSTSGSNERITPAESINLGAQGVGTAPAPQSIAENIFKGDTALGNRDFDRALFYYVEALNQNPDQPLTLVKIGTIHWQRGDLQRSLEAFRRALVIEPANAMALEGEGLALLDLGDRQGARASLERAVGLDGARWRSLQGLGVIADFSGDHTKGAALFRQALEIRRDVPSLHNNLGYSLYLAGDYVRAEQAFFDALKLDPRFERASRNLGLLYVRLGRYEQAVSSLEKTESRPAALNDVGYLLMLDGRYDLAEGYFRLAMEESPVFFERADENLIRNRQLRAAAASQGPPASKTAETRAERAAIPKVAPDSGTGVTDSSPPPQPMAQVAEATAAKVAPEPAVEPVVESAAEPAVVETMAEAAPEPVMESAAEPAVVETMAEAAPEPVVEPVVESAAEPAPVVDYVPATSDKYKRFWLVVTEPALVEARDGLGRTVLSGVQGVTKGRNVYGDPPFVVVTDNPNAVRVFYDGWRRRAREELGNGRFQARFPGGPDFIPGEVTLRQAAAVAEPAESTSEPDASEAMPDFGAGGTGAAPVDTPVASTEVEEPPADTAEPEALAEDPQVAAAEPEAVEDAPEMPEVTEVTSVPESTEVSPAEQDAAAVVEAQETPAQDAAGADAAGETASSETSALDGTVSAAEFVPDPTDKLKRFWLIVTEPTVIEATDSLGRVVLSGEQRVTEGRRIYGEPPFRVESSNPSGFKIYYDGMRQRPREDLGDGRVAITFPVQGER